MTYRELVCICKVPVNCEIKCQSSCMFCSHCSISLTIYQLNLLVPSFFHVAVVHIPSASLLQLKAHLCIHDHHHSVSKSG